MLLALPDGAVALGLGAALAVAAAAVVLVPLWRTAEGAVEAEPAEPGPSAAPAREGVSAVDALREIEFDRETGKLSDRDYAALKATYTRHALAELRASDAAHRSGVAAAAVAAPASAAGNDDAVEATIRRYRALGASSCVACGPRPEPDAAFCSSCGRYLAAHCGRCGAACDAEGQRFCGDCGHALGASVAA